jgi:hypothetical protein
VARRPPRNPFKPSPLVEGDVPSLAQLENFTQLSLRQWLASAKALNELQTAMFFGLELARQQHSDALVEAIRANLIAGDEFQGWARLVDYRYSLTPLSTAGSLKGDGGRFNIGSGLGPANFVAFPALYIAEDYPTAYRERFGTELSSEPARLTGSEFALRAPTSFTHVSLRGQLDLILDIGDVRSLHSFVEIVRKFTLPARIRALARKLGMRAPPSLVRSPSALQRQLLHPNWRTLPAQFDLPSNSQIFGRIVAAAGAHGLLYPSSRNSGKRCLALYPQNWSSSGSYLEVNDAVPSEARLTRIDGTSGAQ